MPHTLFPIAIIRVLGQNNFFTGRQRSETGLLLPIAAFRTMIVVLTL
jgi:hypothetical protein